MTLGETWELKIGKTKRNYVVTSVIEKGGNNSGKIIGLTLTSKQLVSIRLSTIKLKLQ